VTLYGGLGVLGTVLHVSFLPTVTLLGFTYCAYWHARSRYRFPLQRRGIQANKALVRGKPGLLYFGALLGTGVITEMATPLVWTGALFAASSGISAAAGYGIGFGLGRSAPALAAIALGPLLTDYGSLAAFIVVETRQRLRVVGFAGALLGALLSASQI